MSVYQTTVEVPLIEAMELEVPENKFYKTFQEVDVYLRKKECTLPLYIFIFIYFLLLGLFGILQGVMVAVEFVKCRQCKFDSNNWDTFTKQESCKAYLFGDSEGIFKYERMLYCQDADFVFSVPITLVSSGFFILMGLVYVTLTTVWIGTMTGCIKVGPFKCMFKNISYVCTYLCISAILTAFGWFCYWMSLSPNNYLLTLFCFDIFLLIKWILFVIFCIIINVKY